MIRAAIYARYSSGAQREESIEGQLRECKEYAERNGLTIVEEYCDRAISGRTDKREAFQRMMTDSDRHRFDAVIVYTLDRFARDRYDSATYKARLKKNGVKIHYAKGSIPDSPEGIILESVLEGFAEYYSENLSRNVKRGMTDNALQGKSNGHLCLGYKIGADKKWEIDPIGANTVKVIFSMYADGFSASQIINHCNEKGYKTYRGLPFGKSSITRILRNQAYIGIYKYGDLVVEDVIPRIIEQSLWEKVQTMIGRNSVSRARTKAIEDYLLSSKLICGHCGTNMVGECGTSGTGRTYHYYKCYHRKSKNACNKKAERKEWIEDLVIKTTVEQVLTDENIELIATKAIELVDKEVADMSLLHSYEAELKETKEKIKNILDAIEQGLFTPKTKGRLEELEEYEKELYSNIAREKTKTPYITKERLVFWLQSFKYGDINDIDYRRKIVDTFVDKVYVFDEGDKGRKIVITYHTSKNNKTEINLSDIKGSDFDYCGSPKCANPNWLKVLSYKGFAVIIKKSVE